MGILDKLFKEHNFPVRLYSEIRKNFNHNYVRDNEMEANFVDSLPLNFKQEIAYYIYEDVRTKVGWLKDKRQKFTAWICPLLVPHTYSPGEFVYYEGEEIKAIYFARNGIANYVLPQYMN